MTTTALSDALDVYALARPSTRPNWTSPWRLVHGQWQRQYKDTNQIIITPCHISQDMAWRIRAAWKQAQTTQSPAALPAGCDLKPIEMELTFFGPCVPAT